MTSRGWLQMPPARCSTPNLQASVILVYDQQECDSRGCRARHAPLTKRACQAGNELNPMHSRHLATTVFPSQRAPQQVDGVGKYSNVARRVNVGRWLIVKGHTAGLTKSRSYGTAWATKTAVLWIGTVCLKHLRAAIWPPLERNRPLSLKYPGIPCGPTFSQLACCTRRAGASACPPPPVLATAHDLHHLRRSRPANPAPYVAGNFQRSTLRTLTLHRAHPEGKPKSARRTSLSSGVRPLHTGQPSRGGTNKSRGADCL